MNGPIKSLSQFNGCGLFLYLSVAFSHPNLPGGKLGEAIERVPSVHSSDLLPPATPITLSKKH